MAVTQYIGARYVPIFADPAEWSSAVAYEPLTIVLYQGNSYTSRQYVPVGIDIANEQFWAETGNYNAQVEAYRQEVRAFDDRITANADAITAESAARESADDGITAIIGDGFSTSDTVADAIAAESTARAADVAQLESEINAVDVKVNKKVIMVEDYGAVGDGVTNSSNAIQEAIAMNPNCIIMFKGGTYKVTKTIHCWGNLGGQVIDLGGSRINWEGTTENPVFMIDRTDRLQPGDYLYNFLETANYTPAESQGTIMNGTIYAGAYGIYAKAFHSIIDNVKIIDASVAAIVLGDVSEHISLQTKVTDVLIMRSRNHSSWWSEEAQVNGTELKDSACGILCLDPDCNFSDINVNRYPVSVKIVNSGQTFENCHFTAEYKNARQIVANSAAVCFDLETLTSIYTNIFDTCYFDNHKYCLFSPNAIRPVCVVTDGMYFNSNRQIDSTVSGFKTYMAKGVPYLKVNNFNVVPGSRCRFIPAKLLITGSNFQALSLCDETYVMNIYNLTNDAHVFYSANQKSDDGKYVNVIRVSNSLENNQNQCVGCIMLPGENISRFGTMEIFVSDRNYLYYHGLIRGTGTGLTITDLENYGSSRGRYSLWIGEGVAINNDDVISTMFPIYIHANQAFTSTPIYMALDTHGSNIVGFLNGGAVRDFSSSNYLIQKDFTG